MRYSLSTWSVHGQITGGLDLLRVPAEAAARGIRTMEVCHFHVGSRETSRLQELRAAFSDAGVELYSFLIDFGDIVSPDASAREADVAGIRDWIDAASVAGASRVRIDAGRQEPSPEVISLSADCLSSMSAYAGERGIKVVTENWHATSARPGPLLSILDGCGGTVGLCADTGNCEGPDKYDTLDRILPRATSMHYKARYTSTGEIDREDAARIMKMARSAGFDGPVSLIYSDTDREWEAVEKMKTALSEWIAA